jgi:hypothetical protein
MTWLAYLLGVTRGELLGALGSAVGGVIGALGAAFAVYVTLNSQRKEERQRSKDETQRSFSAIVREVIEFTRLALGHLTTCENIHSMAVQLPANRLPLAMAMPKPIVYPAIAGNIGRLARPQQIVGFFTRPAEVENMVVLIAQAARGSVNVMPEDIVHIARAWIDVCELGRSVINEQRPRSEFDAQVRATILGDLDSALPRARSIFGEDHREPRT